MNVELLAKEIKESEVWENSLCEKLCYEAGMEEEYKEADGESFEKVVMKGAEKLGVDIL